MRFNPKLPVAYPEDCMARLSGTPLAAHLRHARVTIPPGAKVAREGGAAVRCSGRLGIVSFHGPREHVLEVLETRCADPAVIVACGVAFLQCVRKTFNRERRGAEFAVIVIPSAILLVSPIRATRQRGTV